MVVPTACLVVMVVDLLVVVCCLCSPFAGYYDWGLFVVVDCC